MLLNSETKRFFDDQIDGLSSRSKILLIGCEGMSALMLRLSSLAHDVYGIDRSQEPTDAARRLIWGSFEVVDPVQYQPITKFHAVIALNSLNQLNEVERYSMIFKISDWLKQNGVLILASPGSREMPAGDKRQYIANGVDGHSERVNGSGVKSDLYIYKPWTAMCHKAGMHLHSEAPVAMQTDAQVSGHQLYDLMSFRKTVQHAILGPFPLPERYRGPIDLSEAAWKPFAERLVRDEFDFVLEVLIKNNTVLDVGSGYGSKSSFITGDLL